MVPKKFTEIDQLLKQIQDRFMAIWGSGDIEKILDEHHPNGVIVHRGSGSVIYGRDGKFSNLKKLLMIYFMVVLCGCGFNALGPFITKLNK